jgi:hypothetical protein
LLLNLIRSNGVMNGYEVHETVNIITSVGRPSYAHAARVARDRALRLAAKCFSTSSWENDLPSCTDFIASNVNS